MGDALSLLGGAAQERRPPFRVPGPVMFNSLSNYIVLNTPV